MVADSIEAMQRNDHSLLSNELRIHVPISSFNCYFPAATAKMWFSIPLISYLQQIAGNTPILGRSRDDFKDDANVLTNARDSDIYISTTASRDLLRH